jgi:hypothetical protein
VQEHLDPDRLILLALSESAPEGGETAHLTECADCRVEVYSLRHVADLGSESQDLSDLPPPPERVWQGIAAEVARLDHRHGDEAAAGSGTEEPGDRGARPALTGLPARAGARRRGGSRRWVAPLVAALAAAIVGVAGTVAVVRLNQRPAPVAVTAHADLAPLPIAPATARGEAEILAGDQLRLDVRNLPLTPGYYQVWLMNPEDLSQMLPVGVLGAVPDTVLSIAPTTDLNRYRLIDISAQAYGGDGTHSGKSVLRGTLTN